MLLDRVFALKGCQNTIVLAYSLIGYSYHYVAKDSELEEVSEFNSCIIGDMNVFLSKLEDESHSSRENYYQMCYAYLKPSPKKVGR